MPAKYREYQYSDNRGASLESTFDVLIKATTRSQSAFGDLRNPQTTVENLPLVYVITRLSETKELTGSEKKIECTVIFFGVPILQKCTLLCRGCGARMKL